MTNAAELAKPKTAADSLRRAWESQARGSLNEAEVDFRQALEQEPKSQEALFGLGLALKAQDRRQDSIQIFERLLALLESSGDTRSRVEMLRRLAKGHINLMRSGDWGLEGEIWKRTE